jgi:predicted XRE-type DNA-binding protein
MNEDQIAVHEGSGNVFADLGLPDPEELLVKAAAVSRISDLIKERGITQAQVATLLGIDQPKVSALLRGRLRGFSLERLISFLIALDQDRRPSQDRATGHADRQGVLSDRGQGRLAPGG